MSDDGRARWSAAESAQLGLPGHSALTVEGRVERAAGVASHVVRARDGRERPLRSSSWAEGLRLVAGAFALLLAVLVVLYVLS